MSLTRILFLFDRQEEAIALDQELFNEYQFSVDQLMELAGHSVACVVAEEYSSLDNKNVLVVCGPGNNGGDGLVASRHLKLFGFDPVVVCLKQGKGDLFQRLIHQNKRHGVPILDYLPDITHPIIIDSLFGFSYRPPLRQEYFELLERISNSGKEIVSVDIPSGWNVDEGPPSDGITPIIRPSVLISLTSPKMCASKATDCKHYAAGRFVPEDLATKYNLQLPPYPGVKGYQVIKVPA